MMATMSGQDEAGAGPSRAADDAENREAALAPRTLLQQLHQVQEELERYYRKCLDLDAERQLACAARDDARLEIEAIRLQVRHLQRALAEAATAPAHGTGLRGLIGRVVPRRRPARGGDEARSKQRLEALRVSELFEADWYLAQYPDVRVAGVDPVAHYDEFGWKEARNPGPRFDTAWYLRANPDVAAANMNPLWHYLQHGRGEGRAPRAP